MKVTYMNGAGNDFMVIDARGQELDFGPMAVELCKLTGADGFMAVDHSDTADFRLHFYNADGSRGEMCGNGARCICKFAYELGIAGEEMSVQTDAGIVEGWRLSRELYRVKLNNPSVLDLCRKEDAAYVELGDPGVPHGVKEVPGLTWDMREQLRNMAQALRYDPAFPKGANINLYTRLNDTEVRILTFERGVEDYTLACGTGSGSVGAVLWAMGQLPGGVLTVHNPGGTLGIQIEAEKDRITGLYLQGPAETVREYEV